MKKPPYTSAERAKRYRENHTAITVHNACLRLIDQLSTQFAAELGSEKFQRSETVHRLVLEANYRYNKMGQEPLVQPPEQSRAEKHELPNSGAMGSVSVNGEEPSDTPNEKPQDQIDFLGGVMRVEGIPPKIEIKLSSQLERKDALKSRGYRFDYHGKKTWAKICPNNDAAAAEAINALGGLDPELFEGAADELKQQIDALLLRPAHVEGGGANDGSA